MKRVLANDPDLDDDTRSYASVVMELGTALDLEQAEGGANEVPMFTRDRWRRCADAGLTGLTIDAEHGGQGAGAVTAVAAFESFGYSCRDNGLIFSVNAHLWSAATPIAQFGTSEQRQRWLPGLCDGSLIGVQGVTEPEAGSDAMSMTTTARPAEDGWAINGTKTYITNAPVADVFVVFATTEPGAGWTGLSAFVVECDTPGLTVSPAFAKMGLASSPMGELHFEDAVIPIDHALGPPRGGLAVFNHSMSWERSFILASAVGTMRRLVEEAAHYARERQQFGQPIGNFQAVSHRIADMATRTEACRALVYRLARLRDAGGRAGSLASATKLAISQAWIQTALDYQETFGALGYMVDGGVEQQVRDALASRVYSGTSDLQRSVIARGLKL